MPSGATTAIVSAFIIGGSALVVFALEKRQKRKSLRLALRTEIEENSSMILLLSEEIIDFTEPASKNILNVVDTTVYESSAGDLGLLTNEEAYAVTRYYSYLSRVLGITRMGVDTEGDSDVNWDVIAEDLEIMQDTAIEILDDPPNYWESTPSIFSWKKHSFDEVDERFKQNVANELSSRESSITPNEWEKRKIERTNDAVRELSQFSVSINLFTLDKNTLFGISVEDMMNEVTEDINMDNLEYQIIYDALDRLRSEEIQSLLMAPVWILREECLLDDETYDYLQRNINSGIIPRSTLVICHLEDHKEEKEIIEKRGEKIFGDIHIVTSLDAMISVIKMKFTKMTPEAMAGKHEILEWSRSVEDILERYNQ